MNQKNKALYLTWVQSMKKWKMEIEMNKFVENDLGIYLFYILNV